MKITFNKKEFEQFHSIEELDRRDLDNEYLSLPYELEINGITSEVNFMIFLSIPEVEEVQELIKKDKFRIMLIDDGADLYFEKQNLGFIVYSSPNPDNREDISGEEIITFIRQYWEDTEKLLGKEVISAVKGKRRLDIEKLNARLAKPEKRGFIKRVLELFSKRS